jgi:hypothetical protein
MILLFSLFHMKGRHFLNMAVMALILLSSCQDPTNELISGKISFSLTSPAKKTSNGRTTNMASPTTVVVTIHSDDGKILKEHYSIKLTSFGEGYLSEPVAIIKSDQQKVLLSEFLVLDQDGQVLYATPLEGSSMAHLVTDPLDIEIALVDDQIVTVTPEVISVENSSPVAFGYSEFAFTIINKIEVILSAFIQNTISYELTNAEVKIEGVEDSLSITPTILSTFETMLAAKANLISVQQYPAYRITVTKDGFDTWQKVMGLEHSQNVNIFLTESNDFDVYVAGYEILPHELEPIHGIAKYWKNGIPVVLGSSYSSANHIFVHQNDVYVAGSDKEIKNALYWKNGNRIDLPFDGTTSQILISGSDLYLAGSQFNKDDPNAIRKAFYIKNTLKTDLSPFTPGRSTYVTGMTVDNNDVYVCGYEMQITSPASSLSYPLMWKNGQVIPLTYPHNPNSTASATPSRIIVKNNHVYISGSFPYYASSPNPKWIYSGGYWKDNQYILLPQTDNENINVSNMDITASGDLYLIGRRDIYPKYWKNGVEYPVVGPDNNSIYLNAISVIDNSVFLAGTHRASTGSSLEGTYWINDKPYLCEGSNTNITSIYVVKH